MPKDFFLLQKYGNKAFESHSYIDHEKISRKFMNMLSEDFDDERFENLLKFAGYIPDLYPNDSSEEVLYSKLVESLVCEWSRRMGYSAELIKQKSSMEDVKIIIDNKVIVCDAKSFRLGRSQQAPNAKDFLKLEDVRKWMDRYKNAIGGLVTYPDTHEWKSGSDIYQYCSTKEVPTVMLPYKYLAYILNNRDRFNPSDLLELWDYDEIFPGKLPKNMEGGNKAAYWKRINKAILRITRTDERYFSGYMQKADELIRECIAANLEMLENLRKDIIRDIKKAIAAENDIEKLKKDIIEYRTKTETDSYDKLIKRIKNFRL